MCFTTDYRGKAKIAKRSIRVYKKIRVNNLGMHYDLKFKGKNTPWEIGIHYTETKFPGVWYSQRYSISSNAFHSAKRKPGNINRPWQLYEMKIGIFRIPKGAKYYENSINYVSSDIIYVKDLI